MFNVVCYRIFLSPVATHAYYASYCKKKIPKKVVADRTGSRPLRASSATTPLAFQNFRTPPPQSLRVPRSAPARNPSHPHPACRRRPLIRGVRDCISLADPPSASTLHLCSDVPIPARPHRHPPRASSGLTPKIGAHRSPNGVLSDSRHPAIDVRLGSADRSHRCRTDD